jgi:hypothetical protein
MKNWLYTTSRGILTPKALWWPKNGLCCFGQVLMIRRCDMIFWEFYGK